LWSVTGVRPPSAIEVDHRPLDIQRQELLLAA
jgi:hypothetical protein